MAEETPKYEYDPIVKYVRYEIRVDDLAGGLPENWHDIKAVVDGQIEDACAALATALGEFDVELQVSAKDLSDVPEGAE